jgi:Na+/proline symporter
MFTYPSRQGPHPRTAARKAAARLRRLAGLVAAVTCGLLASAAVVPAASAMIRVPGPGGQYGPVRPAQVPLHTITAAGMPGWQIALIAAGAAVLAALLAVTADRVRAARRHITAPSP